MASERSLYRKIQEMLDIAKSLKVASMKELRTAIEKEPSDVFRTLQYDEATDQMVRSVSARVIRQTTHMCELLGFLDGYGALTAVGRQALRKTSYDRILAHQVRALLRDYEVDLSNLNHLIAENLQARPPVLPTASQLWKNGAGRTSEGLFARLLTLLAHCGGAESSQSKIYLHISAE